jgi:energy-coupling factor transport system substrate-specific component
MNPVTQPTRSLAAMSTWTTRDLMITAVLGVALGAIFMAYGLIYLALFPLLGQVGIMLLLGFYYLTGTLVPYIVRRPGVAILASFLAAFAEVLLGTPFGIGALWAGLAQGLGAEAVFAARRYRDYSLSTLIAAGIVSGIFAYGYEYLVLSYGALTPAVQLGLLLVRIPSAAILGGWLGKVLGDALLRTGVVRGNYTTR